MADPLTTTPGDLSLDDLRRVARAPGSVGFAEGWQGPVKASAKVIADTIARGDVTYGVNTGFGSLATTKIGAADLADLQVRIVRSHSAGVGPLLNDGTVRLVLLLKAASLGRGFSGVRVEVIEAMLRMLNAGIVPCIPSKGSVGASGDLAPLAHMTLALIGEGDMRVAGERQSAASALAEAGLTPLQLHPKEGLALLNGTQVSTALAVAALFAADDIFQAALIAGAMSTDAAQGSTTPFDPRIADVRGQVGQRVVAAALQDMLAGSQIRDSHRDCGRVQDPYSLRCQPQVMGACLDQLRHATAVLACEVNAVTDNPLVFADTGDVLSGGNFHAEPVALAADAIAIALAEIGNIAERRIALLVDSRMSGLPPFLVEDSGLNSGFMLAQVTAAALASENRSLAHPASVDNIPTSADQEDHVSMATFAARRLGDMTENLAGIVAIELLAAAQGIELHRPMLSSDRLEAMVSVIRERVPHYDQDRTFAPDIESVKDMIAAGRFRAHAVGLF